MPEVLHTDKLTKEDYRLWFEYLRRSNNYKLFCSARREKNPSIENPLWKIDKERILKYPEPHLPETGLYHYLVKNYVVFGDIFTYSTFNKWWNDRKEYIRKQIYFFSSKGVVDYGDKVEIDIDSFIALFKMENDREPTLQEFRNGLVNSIKNSGYLYLRVNVVNHSWDNLKNQVHDLVKTQIKKPIVREVGLRHKRHSSKYFSSVFGKIRRDELEKYLQVYDLREKDKKWLDIAETVLPSNADQETKRREVLRYYKKALGIIKNVEEGIFPGEY